MRKLNYVVCLLTLVSCTSAPDGKPKYKAGDFVQLKLIGSRGQVFSVDCESKDPCQYRVRYEGSGGAMKETDLREFEIEIEPTTTHSNENANVYRDTR